MPKAFFVPLQLSVGTVACLYTSPLLAQVTSDSTVNTQITQNGNIAEITGGETRGGNLFHSFQDFSVPTGNEAFFNNANNISNIFSRVTGGNISNIDGAIRANGNASLFLINPAGIIFGENASLNLGGSFYGSSASSILFENGEFSAVDNLAEPLLTVNAPIGLGFRDNPGDIINRASTGNGLNISPNETIALIGGNVTFDDGSIFAPVATVDIGGLIETGIIDINENGNLSFPESVAKGNILLTNNSSVAAQGEGSSIFINSGNFDLNSNSIILAGINTDTGSFAQAGDVIINATEDVVIDGLNSNDTSISSSVFAEGVGNAGKVEITAKNISFINGGFISNLIENQGDTGDITLNATENILFEGVNSDGNQSQILSAIADTGVGNGGDINITAQNLSVRNGASINSLVFGIGNSGDINLNISDTILIDGTNNISRDTETVEIESSINSNVAFGEGNSGNININTNNLSLDNSGQINVDIAGNGSAGNIDITADNISLTGGFRTRISSDVFPNVGGNGGNISIQSNSLSISDSSTLSASTFGVGNAGNITIQSQDKVSIDQGGIIEAEINLGGTGDGGNIIIDTSELLIANSGVAISTSIFSGEGNAGDINITADLVRIENSFIDALSGSNQLGIAGNIDIEASQLIISDAAQINVASQGEGNGGNLTINASELIQLSGATDNFRGGLVASAVGDGNGGNINITTDELSISNGATIVAGNTPSFPENSLFANGTGQPGNINIEANSISLNSEGRIEAVTQSELGEGANINLQVAEDITLQGDSFISARAINQGDGGNLTIDSRFIIAFPNGNNDILASAEQGQGGNININAESLFGILERPENPQTNDINASSEVSGLDGTVEITTPDTNSIQRGTELPSNIVIPQETAQQACESNREVAAKNGLTISGKGGVVPEPGLPLNSLNVTVNGKNNLTSSIPKPIETAQGKIQPARGIKVTETGEIILTAYRTNNAGERLPEIKRNCDRI